MPLPPVRAAVAVLYLRMFRLGAFTLVRRRLVLGIVDRAVVASLGVQTSRIRVHPARKAEAYSVSLVISLSV